MECDLNDRQILKCPICGTEFRDIITICPNCGNILDSIKLSSSLKAFIFELDEYEKVIANTSKHFKGKSKLAAAKKRKAGLIRNFVFDNDGSTILEALIFIKSKVAVEAGHKANRKTLYWIHLWTEKAEQLYEKARIVLRGNGSIEAAYAYIIETNVKTQKMVRRKVIAGGTTVLILIAMAVLYKPIRSVPQMAPPKASGFGDKQAAEKADNVDRGLLETNEDSTGPVKQKLLKEPKEERIIETLQLKNFTFSIPDYWVEKGSKAEYYQAYAETGGKVAMLAIAYPHDEDEVNLEALYADHENMITAIEAMFDECTVTGYEEFKSDFGVEGMAYHYTSIFDFGGLKYGASGIYACFPSEKDSRWFFVVLIVTDNIEKNYEEDFMEILASVKEVEG